MAYSESATRAYVVNRYPHASDAEREKVIQDWLTKDTQADGIADDFERRVGPLKGLRVLDVGSGNGGITLALTRRGAEADGVDIDEELVALARSEAEARGSAARFTWYSGETLPFPDASFDAAISVSVFEHVADHERVLAEVCRVLTPAGKFYLAFPNRWWPIEAHTKLWFLSYPPRALTRSLYKFFLKRDPVEEYHLNFLSFWTLKRLLRTIPFTVMPEYKGKTKLKSFIKRVLGTLGIHYGAFLRTVMVILEKKS